MLDPRVPHPLVPLGLLLIGVLSTASLVPYMGVFIVETLGKSPLHISVYATIVIVFTLIANRWFGARIDAGARVAPLLLVACCAYLIAAGAMRVAPNYVVLLLVTAPMMAIANTAVTTMYSFGRTSADRFGWEVAGYNAKLRAITSLGWMVAPALAFSVAGAFGASAVFTLGLGFGVAWGICWLVFMPKSFQGDVAPIKPPSARAAPDGIWAAVLVCFLFSVAHAIGAGAIALYVLQERGLPPATPGLMLSAKTFAEIIVILASPWLISKMGTERLLIVAALGALAVYNLMAMTGRQELLVLLGLLEGGYYGTFAAAGLSFVQSFAAGRMGRATALYMNSLFVGALLGSPVMGLLASFESFSTALAGASFPAAGAGLLLLVLERRRVRGLDRPC